MATNQRVTEVSFEVLAEATSKMRVTGSVVEVLGVPDRREKRPVIITG